VTNINKKKELSEVPNLTNRYTFFLNMGGARDKWWIASPVFKIKNGIDTNSIKYSVSKLLSQNDGLNLRYRVVDEKLIQNITDVRVNDVFKNVDIKNVKDDNNLINEIENQVASVINATVEGEKLFYIIYFTFCGSDYHDRMIILAHHLITDYSGFNVIIRKFFNGLNDLSENETAGKGSVLFYDYVCSILNRYSYPEEKILKYWLSMPWRHIKEISELDVNILNTRCNLNVHEIECGFINPIKIIFSTYKNTGWHFSEILYSAVLLSVSKMMGQRFVSVGFVFNSRKVLNTGENNINTIGWFSETIPIIIDSDCSFESILHEVRRQMDFILRNGESLGIYKYKSFDSRVRREMKNIPNPEIFFNYIPPYSRDESWKVVADIDFSIDQKILMSENIRLPYLLSGGVFIKENRMSISWEGYNGLFDQEFLKMTGVECEKILSKHLVY